MISSSYFISIVHSFACEKKRALSTILHVQGAEASASLNTTPDLDDICPPDGSDLLCFSRRDVYRRTSNSTAYVALELDPGNTDDAKSFFTSMVGSSSPWITELASRYSQVLTSKYSINMRHKRAFWINPGHNFNPNQQPPTFVMPTKMLIGMLISLNENGLRRRRAVITFGPGMQPKRFPLHTKTMKRRGRITIQGHGGRRVVPEQQPSTTFSEISFRVNAEEQLKAAAGVSTQGTTTFEVEFDMPQDILCMPDAEAKARLEQLLLEGMQKAADVERVIVTSIRVPEESKLVCVRRLQRMSRSLKSSHDAIIEVLTVRGLRCCCVLTNDAMHHITLTFSWNTDACRISVSHKHGCQ